MRKLIILVSVLLIHIGCSSPSDSDPSDSDDNQTGPGYVASGQITDQLGNGVADVLVTFTGDFSPVMTDADGNWEKEGLSNTVFVRPQKFGHSFEPDVFEMQNAQAGINFSASDMGTSVDLKEGVTIMKPEDRDNISSFNEQSGTLVFEEVTDFTSSLNVGDIIIADYSEKIPYGLINEITSISSDGLTIILEEALLEDVIENGELEVSYSISFEEFVAGLQASKGVKILKVDLGDHKIEFEQELSGDRGTITGFIRLKSNIDFEKRMRFSLRLERLSILFTTEIELDVNYEGKVGSDYEEIHDLFTFRGPPIVVFTGVYISPRIVLRAGAEASIDGGMESGLNWSRTYAAGLEYNRGEGFNTIQNSHGSGFSVKPVKLTGSANAMGFAGVAFEGLVWGSAGFGMGVFGYTLAEGAVELSAEDWKWEYDFSLGAKIASEAKLKISRIADLTYQGPEYDIYRLPIAYAASGKVTDMVEINGELEEVGVPDITILFDGLSATSSSISEATSDENGYWHQDLLKGEVIVKAEKEGFEFEPEEVKIDRKGSSYNFTIKPVDLTGIWEGNSTVTDEEGLQEFFENAFDDFFDELDEFEGCEAIEENDGNVEINVVGQVSPIILELEKIENEQKYIAKLTFVDQDEEADKLRKLMGTGRKQLPGFVQLDSSDEDALILEGEFASNVLTLRGNQEEVIIELTGNFSQPEDDQYKLDGEMNIELPSAFYIRSDWTVTKDAPQ